jgi:hypothetical protein
MRAIRSMDGVVGDGVGVGLAGWGIVSLLGWGLRWLEVVSLRVRARMGFTVVFVGLVVVVVFGGVGVSGAFGEECVSCLPWWHLTSNARPGYLPVGGAGVDEVQRLVVTEASVGAGMVFEISVAGRGESVGLFATEPLAKMFNKPLPTVGNVQKALEENAYGAGNVVVSTVAGAPVGSVELEVKTLNAREVPALSLEGVLGSTAVAEATVTTKASFDGSEIVVTATNLGDASTSECVGVAAGVGKYTSGECSELAEPGVGEFELEPVSIKDGLPAGLRAVMVEGVPESGKSDVQLECSVKTVSCSYTADGGAVAAYHSLEMRVGVVVEGSAHTGEENSVSVSGGGAPLASLSRPVTVSDQPTPFGFDDYEVTPEEQGGTPDTRAGSHPFQLTTTVVFNQGRVLGPEESTHTINGHSEVSPIGLTKDVDLRLPAGLVGNPTPFAKCTLAEFFAKACPARSVVGVAVVTVNEQEHEGLLTVAVPVFNIEPSVGEPARFAFYPAKVPVFVDTSIRTGGDYGIDVNVDNVSQAAGFISSEVTIWGTPGDPRHDSARGEGCFDGGACQPLEEANPPAFLILPTACTGALSTVVESDSWEHPGQFVSLTGEPMPAMDGCNRLPFTPSIRTTPDVTAGSTATGLTVDEHVPQESTLVANGLAESAIKGLTVTLPEGVLLNPSAADGLGACTLAQMSMQGGGAPSCPNSAKVATVKITTPLLPEPLTGAVYLASPQNFMGPPPENPFSSLLALYLFAEDHTAGVIVKATGKVESNSETGQLTTHFEEDPLFAGEPIAARFLPELPAEDIEVHFFGGDRAPLSTPALCGSYTTTGTFTPWAQTPAVSSSSKFEITSGPNGTACSNPLPFQPTLTAGSTSIQAGGFSPFTTTMSREDGNQNLQAISLHMPPGLSGLLSNVKLCGETEADNGTCSQESEIGETTVSVGLGNDPYTVTGGKVYITGPYEGAPFGLSIVNPAVAGPFNLGKVIVRAKIEVDPHTAQLTVTSDDTGPYEIPHIIDGIPLQIKHVNVTINRPNFTFNPTNCDPLAITGILSSTQAATQTLNVPLQVTNCAILKFAPKFQVTTSAKTSKQDGASLNVKLSYPTAPFGTQANIAKVKVDLPKQLPSRLTTLQKACLAATFETNPALCPQASIVGHAKVITPLLPVPLQGPAYFVSHGNEAFPSLTIVLQGYGVTVDLIGSTFIHNGITSTTFKTTPDVPFNTFELNLPQGKYSALTATTNPCKTTLNMPTAFVAQNNTEIHTTTKITPTGCPKTHTKTKHNTKTKKNKKKK